MASFPRALQVVEDAVRRAVTPCAACEVGGPDGARWRAAAGRLWYGSDAPAAADDTVFDLASMTKPLATSALAMRLADTGRLDLDMPIQRVIRGWKESDRDRVTVRHLLAHASGLPAVRSYHAAIAGRAAFESAICREALEYAPGSASIYSDLGFILLGFLLEDVAGAPLDTQFDAMLGDLSRPAGNGRSTDGQAAPEIRSRPPAGWLPRTAPTRTDAGLGRARRGEVDDENAAALGGVAGHAGLFGTAAAVGRLARGWLGAWLGRAGFDRLGTPAAIRRFTGRAAVPGSSRALGWDTMLPTSSCGARMSASAFGHTGYTGTSLWVDPSIPIYAVLLTNRVHPSAGPPQGIGALRRNFHDAVMEACAGSAPA
jgi:serine-type D-Ala-D-Ala carboxypeptidase